MCEFSHFKHKDEFMGLLGAFLSNPIPLAGDELTMMIIMVSINS